MGLLDFLRDVGEGLVTVLQLLFIAERLGEGVKEAYCVDFSLVVQHH